MASFSSLLALRRLPRALAISLLLFGILYFLRSGLFPHEGKHDRGPGGIGKPDGGIVGEYEMLEAGMKDGLGRDSEDGRSSLWRHPLAWLSGFLPSSSRPSSKHLQSTGRQHDLSYQKFAPMDPDPSSLPDPVNIFPLVLTPDPNARPDRPQSWQSFPLDRESWDELYPSEDRTRLLAQKVPAVGQSGLTSTREPIPTDSFAYTWTRPEWYAAALEGGYPEEIPKVQFDFSAARRDRQLVDGRGRGIGWETEEERELREGRKDAVRRGFLYAWQGYKDHAWGHDEVRPVSETTSDAFQGWGATIVDSLETLLIMGLTAEYESARSHVNMVDFRLVNGRDWAFGWRSRPGMGDEGEVGTEAEAGAQQKAKSHDAAGTVSSGKQRLGYEAEAVGVTDSLDAEGTRMEFALKGLLAQMEEEGNDDDDDVIIGSTAMPDVEDDDDEDEEDEEDDTVETSKTDFSLHEIKTKRAGNIPGPSNHRPTWDWRRPGPHERDHLVAGRDVRSRVGTFETGIRYLGGLMGAYDLSGDELMLDRAKDMAEVLLRSFDTLSGLPVNSFDAGSPDYWFSSARVSLAEVGSMTLELTRLSQVTGDPKYFDRAQRAIDYLERVIMPKSELSPLIPFFFDSNVAAQAKTPAMPLARAYGFGAMADSYYEYLIKQHQLIGAATDQYKSLYAGSIDQAYRHLIRESHVVPNRDLVIMGTSHNMDFTPVVDHLTCFAGGMLGLGSRLLDRPRDLFEGARLTDTCYWVGASTPTGLQPESAVFYDDDDEARFQNITVIEQNPVAGEPHIQVEKEILRGAVPGTKTMTNWYIGRPETAESVFYMYRLTGEKKWQDKGWRMFTSWVKACTADAGLSSAKDVRGGKPGQGDNMESFVFAETFKYYYLLQSDPDLISLDDYVFTTEAHPLLLRNQRPGTSRFWDPSPAHLERLNSKLGQTARGTDAQLFQRLEVVRAAAAKLEASKNPLNRPSAAEQARGGRQGGGGGMGGGGGNPAIKPKPPPRGPMIRPKPIARPDGHREGKWDDDP